MTESRMASNTELELVKIELEKRAELEKRIKRLNKVAKRVKDKYPKNYNVMINAHKLLGLY